MGRIAYVNGSYVPHRAGQIHIEDRGFQFGDGIYEVFYAANASLIDEALHLDRLDRSLAALALPPPLSRPALRLVLREVLRRNRIASGLLYLQITRGSARRDHVFPSPAVPATVVVTGKRLPPFPTRPEQMAIAAITLPDQRWARCDIKSVNLLPNVLARETARQRGAAEALLIDASGFLTEGAATSVWLVDAAGQLCLRALDARILPGCTRAALLAELHAAGIAVREAPCTLENLRAAREIFLTGATSFVKPVLRLDGAPVGNGAVGPVTRRLFDLFASHVAREAAS